MTTSHYQWEIFSTLSPQHIRDQTKELLNRTTIIVNGIANNSTPPSWENFALPMEDIAQTIEAFWSPVSHLNAVMNTDEWREAFNQSHPLIVEYFTKLQQDTRLYERYVSIKKSPDYKNFSPEQKRVVELSIRNFELSGVGLQEEKKQHLFAVVTKLAQLMNNFAENHLDSTNFFKLHVEDEKELDGIPESVKDRARELAEKQNPTKLGWILTLQEPCLGPVMSYAKSSTLREKLYKAYKTQASELFPSYAGGSKLWDNSQNINDIMDLRLEKAKLLGFSNFAEYSLALKMADTTDEVTNFLNNLLLRVKQVGEKEKQELQKFSKDTLGIDQLQPWDIGYASEQLKLSKFQIDDEEIRKYFPCEKVIQGLFLLAEELYDISIEKIEVPVYHHDVMVYQLTDKTQKNIIGHFYLDLFARENKRSGAWVDSCRTRHRNANGKLDTPITYIVCNFPNSTSTRPSYLSHYEILTLFHEFGHALHQLLTSVELHSIAGFNGVEWDAVELPSQFMENFAWDQTILTSLSSHETTTAQLPEDLYLKIIDAKNFQVGLRWLRQIEFSIFDFQLHKNWSKEPRTSVMEELWQVQDKVAVIIPPKWNRFPMTFDHIFACSYYAAGYYSYKWAEVLSADAFAAFEENGTIVNKDIGNKFLKEIISRGASRPMKESFFVFRGREPEINALLRHNGI
ncbi:MULTISPECIES: M3 family metallopeptidase [Candidatus Ichthyocystis]|uniref:oligopeptidase A n=1 Tax=Candidatus Ichthyocystis hellenicum TaxID=1561003 RepID=A0A0S4M137_9BURK|nr:MULTISPECIES: M3 family metallopeptidase [Ichthyocystis]CUT17481.1 Oligopeptidase A [Candidatus Ichthyocystis hellenicum]